MRILVVGSGGREHAIIRKLKESPSVTEIFCAPGNGGIAADAACLAVRANDIPGMVAAAKENKIDFVVVAPEDPLSLGMVDAMESAGVPAFGPTRLAARLESSKVFSKDLMRKYGVPTAGYEVFERAEDAIRYVGANDRWPVVVKADGLALGKGVVIAEDRAAAEAALTSMMEDKIFGESGSRVVIEEFLTGPEVSVLAFSDGEALVPMVSSMDHKRVFDGNKGPNTGGMGAIAPNPHYGGEMADRCMEEIFLPTVRAMAAEGCPFKGCLYFGLMLTPDGPKVIEYNCRFGDPETQVVLPLLEADLLAVFRACHDGGLDKTPITWKGGAAACVMLASGGYPGQYETGFAIAGLDSARRVPGAAVYHSGTKKDGDAILTAGGRVLGVTAVGNSLGEALARAYKAAEGVSFEGMQYRRDIGKY